MQVLDTCTLPYHLTVVSLPCFRERSEVILGNNAAWVRGRWFIGKSNVPGLKTKTGNVLVNAVSVRALQSALA